MQCQHLSEIVTDSKTTKRVRKRKKRQYLQHIFPHVNSIVRCIQFWIKLFLWHSSAENLSQIFWMINSASYQSFVSLISSLIRRKIFLNNNNDSSENMEIHRNRESSFPRIIIIIGNTFCQAIGCVLIMLTYKKRK